MTDLKPSSAPPVADRRSVRDTRHAITRTDYYHWLRDEDWQQVMRDPACLTADIRAYLEAENAYTSKALAPVQALRETLFAEMKGRLKQDDSSVPMPDGPFEYYQRHVEGGEQPLYCRRDKNTPETELVVMDGNKAAEGHAYFNLGGAAHSPDHRFLAWSSDSLGSEYFNIHLRDIETGEDAADLVPDSSGDMVWARDGRTFFYVGLDENHRPARVFRQTIGGDAPVLVYEEEDPAFYVGVGLTQSGRYVLIDIHDHQTSEQWIIDADAPGSAPRLVEARRAGVEYSLDHDAGSGRFLILTNRDDAEDFKLCSTSVDTLGAAHWQDFIAHQAGRLIVHHVVFADHVVRHERVGGLDRIVVHRLGDGEEHEISFDEEAYALGLSAGYEYNTRSLFFSYSSMTTPRRVYEYNMETRERQLRKEQEVPSGHDPSAYITRRIFALADDGTKVPVSLLYRKETKLDGSAPALLYGYGSYGISIPPSFSTNAVSLVDRGFVYAIAHIRGGKDMGYRWYSDGKLQSKKNTFTDFIAAAQFLIAEKITAKGAIVAQGGSAGGMLMGAVANMAPDLFAGFIAEVPFVDVLNTMLDDSLPLTPPEWLEWGDPIKDAEAYAYMASYSPYDNVMPQAYPPILALAGLTDPRVTYWEPAKWIAELRTKQQGDGVILLRTNMEAGHGGAAGRFARLKEVALAYAFALAVVGRA